MPLRSRVALFILLCFFPFVDFSGRYSPLPGLKYPLKFKKKSIFFRAVLSITYYMLYLTPSKTL